ncbi:MAG: JDVT-CTERM system glutamic-type intramembrane protease [Deferribacterales bacterium]
MVKKSEKTSAIFGFFVAAGLLWLGVRLYMGRVVFPEPFMVLVLLVIAPVCEELFFRGFVQDVIRRRLVYGLFGLTLANVLTSVLFACVHLFSWGAFHSLLVFFPSLAFGYVFDRTGKISLCVLLHALYNLNAFIV